MASQEPRMIRLRGDGITIQAADWPGQGLPVLAVHGLTANCRSFDLVARSLAPAHRVIALDLRGRGLSDKPDSGYSLADHGRDIRAVLDDLGLERVALLGHSLGAYICLALTAESPELVDRLILLDGGADLSPEQWAKVSAGIKPSLDRLGQLFPSFEDYIARIKQAPFMQPWNQTAEDYFRYESEEVEGGVRSRIHPDHITQERANLLTMSPREFYPAIKCPVLILRATEGMLSHDDLVLPRESAQDLASSLARGRVVDLPGINHFSLVFQPSPERDQALRDFLD